jgi:4a-hydroxytetrahydrobiopterin dehydratase
MEATEKALSPEKINAELHDLPGWEYDEHSLKKSFELGDFKEAMSFLVRLAFHADAANHHPEIWNVYNKVKITLTTHDAGDRVTQKDMDLAKTIEQFNWTKA